MTKRIRRFFAASCCVLLLFGSNHSALADVSLPEGTVEGLPQKLTVMDSEGNSVNSDTGEFFFSVENMAPFETYSKDVQVMNLREDKAYHIYFYTEPVNKSGKIDLEDECSAVITLDGNEVYNGKVTGKGNIDLTKTPIDLGLYEPGAQRSFNCSITWNGSDAGGFIDNGKRIVDAKGTTVVEEGGGDKRIYGEVTFRWIFYAVVDEDYVPPKTGLLSNLWIEISILSAVGAALIILLMLILKKRKKTYNGSRR